MVVSWLVKLVLFTAVAAFVLLNAGAIVTNIFGLSNNADEIAISLSTTMAGDRSMSPFEVQQQAEQMASKDGAKVVRVWVDGHNVLHVRLQRRAHVALIGDIKPLKHFVVAKQTGTSSIG